MNAKLLYFGVIVLLCLAVSAKKVGKNVCKVCGKSKFKKSIVPMIAGGEDAKKKQFPWHVLILNFRIGEIIFTSMCAGNLVSSTMILTTATCFSLYETNTRLAVLGLVNMEDLFKKDDKQRRVPILNHFVNGEIALALISSQIPFTEYILPICLPKNDDFLEEYNEGIVAGFGENSTGILPKALQHATLKVEECGLSNDEICARNTDGKGICWGDKGGGLVMQIGNERSYLVGMPDSDLSCGNWTIYMAKISTYYTWITGHDEDLLKCK